MRRSCATWRRRQRRRLKCSKSHKNSRVRAVFRSRDQFRFLLACLPNPCDPNAWQSQASDLEYGEMDGRELTFQFSRDAITVEAECLDGSRTQLTINAADDSPVLEKYAFPDGCDEVIFVPVDKNFLHQMLCFLPVAGAGAFELIYDVESHSGLTIRTGRSLFCPAQTFRIPIGKDTVPLLRSRDDQLFSPLPCGFHFTLGIAKFNDVVNKCCRHENAAFRISCDAQGVEFSKETDYDDLNYSYHVSRFQSSFRVGECSPMVCEGFEPSDLPKEIWEDVIDFCAARGQFRSEYVQSIPSKVYSGDSNFFQKVKLHLPFIAEGEEGKIFNRLHIKLLFKKERFGHLLYSIPSDDWLDYADVSSSSSSSSSSDSNPYESSATGSIYDSATDSAE